MTSTPYQFLVRWDKTGRLQGVSIETYEELGLPQPVAVAGQIGFPLTDVLSAIQSGAILSMDESNAALVAEQNAHAVTQAALGAALAKLGTIAP